MRTTKNKKTACQYDKLFLAKKNLTALLEKTGTPLYLYDEKGLRRRAKSLFSTFSELPELQGYFPVHLCPRQELLGILGDSGMGAYCLTAEELHLAIKSGIPGEKIIFAPMTLSADLAELIREIDAELMVVNPVLLHGVLPRRVTLACSPVRTKRNNFTALGHHRAPLGLVREEVWEQVPRLAEAGIDLGLAIIDGMNITDEGHLGAKLASLVKYEAELCAATGIHIRRLHPGEGPGIRYNRLVPPMDLAKCAELAAAAVQNGNFEVSLNFGKQLMEPCGIIVTSVLSIIQRERPTLVVDAMTTQMQPSQVDRYRHVSIVGKNWVEGRILCDVIGSLALTGDWFTERRVLPEPTVGDLLVFHDAGCAPPHKTSVPCYLWNMDGTVLRLQHGEE